MPTLVAKSGLAHVYHLVLQVVTHLILETLARPLNSN